MHLCFKYFFYLWCKISTCLSCLSLFSLLLHKFTEQYTGEQQDTDGICGETPDLDTKILESTVEVTESKDSTPLALVEGANEMIIQDSFSEEVNLDITVEADGVIEGMDESDISAIGITIHG